MEKPRNYIVAQIVIGVILFVLVMNILQLILTTYQMTIAASSRYLIANMGDTEFMNMIANFCAILCIPLIAIVFAEAYKTYFVKNAFVKKIINYSTIALEVIGLVVVVTLFFMSFADMPSTDVAVGGVVQKIQAVDYALCVTFQSSLLYVFTAICALIIYGIFIFKRVELQKPLLIAALSGKEEA